MRAMTSDSHNAVRFARPDTDHVESYFLKATSPEANRALWLKATIFSAASEPGRAVAEGWAIAFDHRAAERHHVAVKRSVPLGTARFGRNGLDIAWEDAPSGDNLHMTPGACRGAITMRGRTIQWDLCSTGDDRPFVLFPYEWMYRGPLPSSKTITPYPDLRLTGKLEVDGQRWDIADWRGMQGHNWGRGHADSYAWCHCNQWDEPVDLVVEAVSARIRLGSLLTPALSAIYLRHEGRDYAFNGLPQLLGTRSEVGLRRYTFSATDAGARLQGLFEARAEDFVGLYYPNPQGHMTHCLNSKLARGRIRLELKGHPALELRTRAAALELGTRRAEHGVKMYV
jgi:hypothetical protein